MAWADSPHKTIGVNFDLAFGTELQGHHTYFDLQFTDGVRGRHVKGSPTGRLASRAVQTARIRGWLQGGARKPGAQIKPGDPYHASFNNVGVFWERAGEPFLTQKGVPR